MKKQLVKTDSAAHLSDDIENFELKKIQNTRVKFVVSGWKFINYCITSAIGIYCLSVEEWMWNPVLYFKNFDFQSLSAPIKLYYQIGLASYIYASISVFIQPKQKDFYIMLVHHVTTLFLIYTSLLSGLHRIGSVILVLHEISDPFMEVAKLFLYSGACKAIL